MARKRYTRADHRSSAGSGGPSGQGQAIGTDLSRLRQFSEQSYVRLHERQGQTAYVWRAGGQRRRGPGYSGLAGAGLARRRSSDAKTPEEYERYSTTIVTGQARIMPLGAARSLVLRADRTRVVGRITGPEVFHTAIATTRTTDEALQVPWVGTALSLNPRRRLQCVQRSAPSDLPPNPARISPHRLC